MGKFTPFTLLLGLVPSSVLALTTSTRCPSSDVCFTLTVPDTTAASGTGDISLSITGPTTYSWISVAQGSDMGGANYFVIYTDASGTNVTVSPRLARGEVMPTYNSDANFEILAGTGVENGIMTANIRCLSCNTWQGGSMQFTSQSTNWIWAHNTGSPLNTDSTSAAIRQHDRYGRLTFNTASNSNADPSTGLTSTSASQTAKMITAHAILACLAWAFMFPLGGTIIRLLSFPGLIWMHAGLQILGYSAYIAAAGLGIYVAANEDYLKHHHAIIGVVLLVLISFQSLSGYFHHVLFKKYLSRNVFSWIHIWTGRVGITLGIVNGGFGFQLRGKGFGDWQVVVFTVCAVLMWGVYVGAAIFGEVRRGRKDKEGERGSSSDGEAPLKERGVEMAVRPNAV